MTGEPKRDNGRHASVSFWPWQATQLDSETSYGFRTGREERWRCIS